METELRMSRSMVQRLVGQYGMLYIGTGNTTVRYLRVLGNGPGVPITVSAASGTTVFTSR